MENTNLLQQIYNTLSEIETKGQDTIHMASCLVTLSKIIAESTSQMNPESMEEEQTNVSTDK